VVASHIVHGLRLRETRQQACAAPRGDGGSGILPFMPALSSAPGQTANAFARARDERLCWLLTQHPVTAAMLVEIGWFPSKDKALKRLRRLAARQRIRLVGTVCRKEIGRPEHVYCCYRIKVDLLAHEVELTALCLRLDAGEIRRGPHILDTVLRPDAEVWIRGERYCLELDRGTMGKKQLQQRFAIYASSRSLVLWICSSETRRESLRACAGEIRHLALFTTLAEAMADPHAAIWVDHDGGRAALPRERGIVSPD
jgi:hypothetical protein